MSNEPTNSTQNDKYVPPKVWVQDKESGGKFASINSPTSGARYD